MPNTSPITPQEEDAIQYVKGLRISMATRFCNLFGPNWERKQIEKRLGRPL
jgi:hypothetical protein